MKNIYPDRVTTATALSENANFPATNLLNEIVKSLWKAADGVAATSIQLTVPTQSGGVALFNTNATAVSVSLTQSIEVLWDAGTAWDSGTAWYESSLATPSQTFGLDADGTGSLFAEWDEITDPHVVVISLTQSSGDTLYAGVATSGDVNTFKDPFYGIGEGLEDKSIRKELSNGAIYRRKRDVLRTFDFRLQEDREIDFYKFMLNIMKRLGPFPIAWRIVHKASTDFEWVVYASARKMPSGRHHGKNKALIDIQLREEL